MYNCIFTAHCTRAYCDGSCPALVETSYLLERNGITMNSFVFQSSDEAIHQMLDVLIRYKETTGTVVVPARSSRWDTVKLSLIHI